MRHENTWYDNFEMLGRKKPVSRHEFGNHQTGLKQDTNEVQYCCIAMSDMGHNVRLT
jgi:hypothetical protein